jgi:chemotaxis signal transduction protein
VDVAELEMVIFGVGGFSFGTEVSQIVSIVRCQANSHQMIFDSRFLIFDLLSQPQSQIENPKSKMPGTSPRTRGPQDVPSAKNSTDLRARGDNGTVVLLVDTDTGITGIRVESVKGAVKMSLEQIEPLPDFLKSRIQTDCIWGIGKLGQGLVILLDLDRYVARMMGS